MDLLSTQEYRWMAFHVVIQEPSLLHPPSPGVLGSFTSSQCIGKEGEQFVVGLKGMFTSSHFSLARAWSHGHTDH